MAISSRAVALIISQEDGDQAYYEKTEEHWDWPGGNSGPTIGVGYDCGYETPASVRGDWGGLVDDETLASILKATGKTGGQAHLFVIYNRDDVTIPWALALQQFTERELPKWENKCRAVLPNFDLLSPDCQGALVSLAYNRGTDGFNSPLPRFREMRAIKDYMIQGRWPLIPTQISAMMRLWPNVMGLRRRRVAEAQLFAEGLGECRSLTRPSTSGSVSSSSSVAPSPQAPSTSPEPSPLNGSDLSRLGPASSTSSEPGT